MISLPYFCDFKNTEQSSRSVLSGQPVGLLLSRHCTESGDLSKFPMYVVCSTSVDQLFGTSWQVCFPVDVLVRRFVTCMYGPSSRYWEFAVDLFGPAILSNVIVGEQLQSDVMHVLSMLRFNDCDERGQILVPVMVLKCLTAASNLDNSFLKCFCM